MRFIYFLKGTQAIIFFLLSPQFSDAYLRNKSCMYLRHMVEQLYMCIVKAMAKSNRFPRLHCASVEISSKSDGSTSQWHHARPYIPKLFHLINENIFTSTNTSMFLRPSPPPRRILLSPAGICFYGFDVFVFYRM